MHETLLSRVALCHLVDVRQDLDRLAEDEERAKADQDEAEVLLLAVLPIHTAAAAASGLRSGGSSPVPAALLARQMSHRRAGAAGSRERAADVRAERDGPVGRRLDLDGLLLRCRPRRLAGGAVEESAAGRGRTGGGGGCLVVAVVVGVEGGGLVGIVASSSSHGGLVAVLVHVVEATAKPSDYDIFT